MLPAMAGRLSGRLAAMAFVDAFLPPASGAAHLIPAEFIEKLSELATDDLLPPWSS